MTSEKLGRFKVGAEFEFGSLSEARNYRHALIKEFSPWLRGNLLEVGAGIGQMTQQLLTLPSIRKVLSVEPSKPFCRLFREHFPEVALVEGTIQDVPSESKWDVLFSINVLEHIEKDVVELTLYREYLESTRGNLCLFVPAGPAIYAPIDKDFGHFRRYTAEELSTKLKAAGFEVLRLKYFNFAGFFLWWLNFRILKKRHFNRNAVKVFDTIIFPIVYTIERLVCRPPIGQSLLVVARPKN